MSERRKTRKRIEYVIGIGFLICVLGIGIINLLLPSKKISEEENRGLQQKPELSVSAVTSGSYMDQYEKYQADQFMGRNMWRSLKVGFSRLAGSKEENGVFIGKKGQLLEDIAVPDQDVLKANMKAIQSFSQKYSDIPGCGEYFKRQASVYRYSCRSEPVYRTGEKRTGGQCTVDRCGKAIDQTQ